MAALGPAQRPGGTGLHGSGSALLVELLQCCGQLAKAQAAPKGPPARSKGVEGGVSARWLLLHASCSARSGRLGTPHAGRKTQTQAQSRQNSQRKHGQLHISDCGADADDSCRLHQRRRQMHGGQAPAKQHNPDYVGCNSVRLRGVAPGWRLQQRRAGAACRRGKGRSVRGH